MTTTVSAPTPGVRFGAAHWIHWDTLQPSQREIAERSLVTSLQMDAFGGFSPLTSKGVQQQKLLEDAFIRSEKVPKSRSIEQKALRAQAFVAQPDANTTLIATGYWSDKPLDDYVRQSIHKAFTRANVEENRRRAAYTIHGEDTNPFVMNPYAFTHTASEEQNLPKYAGSYAVGCKDQVIVKIPNQEHQQEVVFDLHTGKPKS